MSFFKNFFVNFYLDFDKIENVGWKISVDNLYEFYRIWCNIFLDIMFNQLFVKFLIVK